MYARMFTRACACLALGVTATAHAGTYSPPEQPQCIPQLVSVPCVGHGFDVGFEAWATEGTVSDENYAVRRVDTDDDNIIDFDFYQSVRPDHHFGYEIEVSYHFWNANDIIVAWEHLDATEHASTDLSNIDLSQIPTPRAVLANSAYLTPGPSTAFATAMNGTHDVDFDALNVELAQFMQVGEDFGLRFHGGFQYVDIDFNKIASIAATDVGANINANQTVTLSATHHSDFKGAGVRVGTDGAYHCGPLSVVLNASLSLLVGDIDTHADATLAVVAPGGAIVSEATTRRFTIESDNTVVPAAMLKAAMRYEFFAMDNHLYVEGGWRWEGYFHSMRFSAVEAANYENFTMSGPFIAAKFIS